MRYALLACVAALVVGCSKEAATEAGSQLALTGVADSGTVRIDYNARPNPPREGNNDVQVTVKNPDGSPVPNAEVSVTYYMPAMPAMNMPEMKDAFPLAHRADGTYSGTVRLSMGGTWQVTVAVAQGGEQLGKKRFTIIARE
jgi:hypothetical protein